MLRNILKNSPKNVYYSRPPRTRNVSTTTSSYAKNASSGLSKQGKIMSKLFGNRVVGSKKRWYPDSSQTAGGGANHNIFKASNLSKPGSAGKNTVRRTAVLNKLFMEQISSLMATGEVSEAIIGKGLQLTRVKIAPDFASVNVYWMAKGDAEQDGILEKELKKCSGIVRHELSQLRVMGEVPRINFVHDRTFANIELVDNILRNMDFGTESEGEEENEDHKLAQYASVEDKNRNIENIRKKEEFFGNFNMKSESTKTHESENDAAMSSNAKSIPSLPPMRHDVFGLDHSGIMAKIRLKMRKSKLAWDTHNQKQSPTQEAGSSAAETVPTNKTKESALNIQKNFMETNDKSEELRKFLAQRRKNTPERKKYNRDDHLITSMSGDTNSNDYHDDEVVLSERQRKLLNEEDYILDDEIANNRRK